MEERKKERRLSERKDKTYRKKMQALTGGVAEREELRIG